jgi:phage baseplate assembly protein V
MLKFGTVTKLNYKKALAKVVFREEQGRDGGEKFAIWLPVLQTRTKKDAYYTMPDKGEIVACVLDESWETGAIIGAVYTKKNQPTSRMNEDRAVVEFDDGTVIEYDRTAKKLTMELAGTLELTTQDKAEVTINGNLNLTINGTATIEATSGTMEGIMDQVMKRITNTMKKTFNAHTHPSNLAPPLPTSLMIEEV